jgi:hypothetical protein
MSSNPFFAYQVGRIEEGMTPAPQTAEAPAGR